MSIQNYKTDYLKIKLTDNYKREEVKKFIRRNEVDDVVFFFDTEQKNLMVRCCLRNGDMEYNIPFEMDQMLAPKFKKVIVKVSPVYAECDWLLSTEYIFDCNSHNLDAIKMKDSGTEYWLDTLFIRKGNKLIRHDEICFDGCQMFK